MSLKWSAWAVANGIVMTVPRIDRPVLLLGMIGMVVFLLGALVFVPVTLAIWEGVQLFRMHNISVGIIICSGW